MVDAVMDLNKFSGKKIKKALHTCDDLNLRMYEYGRNVFGDDWMNQDENLILKCLNSNILFAKLIIDFI